MRTLLDFGPILRGQSFTGKRNGDSKCFLRILMSGKAILILRYFCFVFFVLLYFSFELFFLLKVNLALYSESFFLVCVLFLSGSKVV